jgi:hypothetical protein
MAVHVDLCEARVTCFDIRCKQCFQLSMQPEGEDPHGYDLDCIEGRLDVRQQHGAEIVYNDETRRQLAKVGL